MEIIDKYGYLEDVLNYIEKNIIKSRGWQKTAKKAKVKEELLKGLSGKLKYFSETSFFTLLQEKLEDRHSSIAGATAELCGADVGIEVVKNKAFVLINFKWDIVVDGEKEDKVLMDIKMFSKNDIRIKIV